jgi:hypothetical protein
MQPCTVDHRLIHKTFTMKKFKYPLAITGNKQQLEEIAEELKKIGYRKITGSVKDFTPQVLVTNAYRMNGSLNTFKTTADTIPRTNLSADQKDLILALAAMTESEKDFSVGEWVVEETESWFSTLPTKRPLRIDRISNHGGEDIILSLNDVKNSTTYLSTSSKVRKATKKELIELFTSTKPTQTAVVRPLVDDEFLKYLYKLSTPAAKELLEKKFPTLFPQEQFRAGDRIEVTVDGGVLHLMIHRHPSDIIGLVNLLTGESTYLHPQEDKIFGKSFVAKVGKDFGLTETNFKKLDCSKPQEISSSL